jgi:hypothetical protein
MHSVNAQPHFVSNILKKITTFDWCIGEINASMNGGTLFRKLNWNKLVPPGQKDHAVSFKALYICNLNPIAGDGLVNRNDLSSSPMKYTFQPETELSPAKSKC